MLAYATRRVLLTVPVMGVVALFVFSLLHFTPGDPALVVAGEQATPEEVEKIRIALGLDQPLHYQFFFWMMRLFSGDLGTSIFSNQPVALLIWQRLAPTFSLLVFGLLVAVCIGVPFGMLAAWKRGKLFDRVFTGITVLGFSVPNFVIAYVLALVFASTLKWLPVQGYVPPSDGIIPWIRSLILPAFTIGLGFASLIARITRTSMLEVLAQDYVRTARAKGAEPMRILVRHTLKNASIPIVTIIGLGFAGLIGGAVITESIFSIPGLGRLTLDAITHRDYPIIQALVLVFSAAYVLINLAVDLIYVLLDPRIRY